MVDPFEDEMSLPSPIPRSLRRIPVSSSNGFLKEFNGFLETFALSLQLGLLLSQLGNLHADTSLFLHTAEHALSDFNGLLFHVLTESCEVLLLLFLPLLELTKVRFEELGLLEATHESAVSERVFHFDTKVLFPMFLALF